LIELLALASESRIDLNSGPVKPRVIDSCAAGFRITSRKQNPAILQKSGRGETESVQFHTACGNE
jgi:hypothetical protein